MADNAGAAMRGELRATLEGLLRTCADLDRRSSEAVRETRDQSRAIASELAGLRVPGIGNLAEDIAGIGSRMESNLTAGLADARRPYLEQANELLALLAPIHGVADALPTLNSSRITTLGATTIVEHFPPGFARDYVGDILGSLHRSTNITANNADHIAPIRAAVAENTAAATGAEHSERHREQGTAMLSDPTCHAVERHGPHIPNEAQLARLIWRKDFTGEYAWQLMPDGTVTSDHNVGAATGGFTSPEAMAKPIDAFLRHAHRKHDDWNEFLNSNTKKHGKRVIVHVSAEHAGLVAKDVSGYKGAATGSREARQDWLAARQYAMDTAGTPVFAVPYNPIEVGSDPGASLIFKRTDAGWRLLTCFPVDEQHPDSKRLENLT